MLKGRVVLPVLIVIGLMLSIPAVAWCDEDGHDYSGLKPGDKPRPEYEFVLDMEYWLSLFPLDEMIPPEAMEILEVLGLNSIERTNLIAYERGDHIVFQSTYEMEEGGDGLVKYLFKAIPPESKILGHMNNDDVLMSMYVAGLEGVVDAVDSMITDPVAVDLFFEGDMDAARMAKLGFKSAKAQAEGMFLDMVADESMLVFYENPDFTDSFENIPFTFAWVAPSADGDPVAPEILELIYSFAGMAGMFGGLEIDSEELRPEVTKIQGHDCYYWEVDKGFEIGMLDADGYLFASTLDGLELILDSFDTQGDAFEALAPANLYMYMDYDAYIRDFVVPMLDILETEMASGEKDLPPEIGEIFSWEMDILDTFMEKFEDVDSLGWVDMAVRFTGDGFEFEERVDTDFAEAAYTSKEEMTEFFLSMFADMPMGPMGLMGMPGQECYPPSGDDEPVQLDAPIDENTTPGAVF